MARFIERHPAWALIVIIAVAVLAWLVFAIWPPGLEAAVGRKRVFLNAVLNGITLGGLYFLVASGFTLIFGLMRNVKLAHGSLYLFGGYVGYAVSTWTGSWILSFIVAFIAVALVGVILQIAVFRRMEGQDLRHVRNWARQEISLLTSRRKNFFAIATNFPNACLRSRVQRVLKMNGR